MKKLIVTVLLLLFSAVPVCTARALSEAPQLMVTDCTVSEGGLCAGEQAYVSITLENKSTAAAAVHCKLTFSESTADILPVGTGTQYVESIAPGESYVWTLPVSVSANAADGNHLAEVSIAYTAADGSTGIAADVLRLQVIQTARLEIGSLTVPDGVVQGETASLECTALNTGKSTLHGVTMLVCTYSGEVLGKDALGSLPAGQGGSGTVRFPTAEMTVGRHEGYLVFSGETTDGVPVSTQTSFSLRVEQGQQAAQENRSRPRLYLESYTVEGDALTPGENRKLTMVFVNNHPEKTVTNILLRFTCGDTEIAAEGVGTDYPSSLAAGESYVWELPLQASHTARSGVHDASVAIEYEDSEGNAYSAADVLRLAVRQRVQLVWDSLLFPPEVVSGETATLSLTVQNMGGAVLQNVLLTFETQGLSGSGSVLVGTVQPGQSSAASANFNVTAEAGAEVGGLVRLQYTDDYGEYHSEDIPFSATAVAKPQPADPETQKKEQQADRGMRLWWLFLVGGLVVGIGGGAGCVYSVFSRKSRLQDEERL